MGTACKNCGPHFLGTDLTFEWECGIFTLMSRTNKGSKGPGHEYWASRLDKGGEAPGRETKRLTHRKERRAKRDDERKALIDVNTAEAYVCLNPRESGYIVYDADSYWVSVGETEAEAIANWRAGKLKEVFHDRMEIIGGKEINKAE